MANVLARELDSYSRAAAAYQRQANAYNRELRTYQDSLVRDDAGNIYVLDSEDNVQQVDPSGRVTPADLPHGSLNEFGVTAIPDEDRYRLLRAYKADSYPIKPDDFTKTFNRTKPNPTTGQLKRLGMPSLAQYETGLIGQVMRGGGAR